MRYCAAAASGQNIVKELIRRGGMCPAAVDPFSYETALHLAVAEGHNGVVRVLHGAG